MLWPLTRNDNATLPVGEPIKGTSRSAVWQRATEHLNRVLSEDYRIEDAFETGMRRNGWCLRRWDQIPGLRGGQVRDPPK